MAVAKTRGRLRGNVLLLERFIPYRLNILASTVSGAIAAVYSDQFDLTIPEWRVMAILARFPGLSAAEVAARTSMDKVQVSRAAARLLRTGRIVRRTDKSDARRSNLRLSDRGRRVYQCIVPVALASEQDLLAALNKVERKQLDKLLKKLQGRANRLKVSPEAKRGRA